MVRRARILQAVRHEGLQNVLSVETAGGRATVVLEASRGVPLAEAWKPGLLAMRPPGDSLAVIRSLLSTLVVVHRAGLAHGCLSPHTIRIDSDDRLQINVCRFDAAAESSSAAADSFFAPEARQGGEPQLATDVYGAAAVIVWLLTGRFDGNVPTRELLDSALHSLPPGKFDLNSAAERLQAALSSAPEDRGTLRELNECFCPNSAVVRALHGTPASPLQEPDPFEATSVQKVVDDEQGETRIQDAESAAASALSYRRMDLERRGSIGRYRVLKKLGAGGMGDVYQAEDPADGRIVAIKVLSPQVSTSPAALKRFRKEARLLSEVRHPNVTNLLDVNEDDGIHYLVMEFVSGKDLRVLLREHTPLTETRALELIAEVARALEGAHERGIVHRDIKPANILLEDSPLESAAEAGGGPSHPRVKLTDFGLARHVDQSESMQLTKAGAMLGTPYYMSPEQCSGRGDVTPATDVYALGVTLFELLAGRLPFEADDPVKLVAKHCFDDVPALQKFNPAVSEATVRIVEKALSKSPADRYADAGALLRDVERCLRGEPAAFQVHPALPAHEDGTEVYDNEFTWDLESTPHEVWPHVANTDRVNEAMGLPPVKYSTGRDEQGRPQRFGHVRLAGLGIDWIEHPFEWVEGQRHGVLREFRRGPFVWFQSIVELSLRTDGGTRLTHRIRIKPRNLVGSLVARREIGSKARKSLDRVYRRIDEVLANRSTQASQADPFTAPPRLSRSQRARLAERTERLRSSGASAECVEALAEYLAEAPAPEVARIRPAALARRFRADVQAVVETLLRSVPCGMLELYWDILCPTCRVSSGMTDTLREIQDHGHCDACDLDFEVDFGNSIEMVFRAHPEVRRADAAVYCAGGPGHAPHVVAQVRLAAGEFLELATGLDEGDYILRSPQLPYTLPVVVRPREGVMHASVTLGGERKDRELPVLRAGRQSLSLVSEAGGELVLRLERALFRREAYTAAQAAACALFRELFPGEVLGPGRLLSASTVTLLAWEFCEVDALLEEMGDARVYELLHEASGEVTGCIARHGGAVVRNNDGRMLASFQDAADAVPAVLESAERLSRLPLRKIPAFRAALHRGSALVTTHEGSLDYFGRSVSTVFALIEQAEAGEFRLHESVGADAAVAEALHGRGCVVDVVATASQGLAAGLVHRVRLDPRKEEER